MKLIILSQVIIVMGRASEAFVVPLNKMKTTTIIPGRICSKIEPMFVGAAASSTASNDISSSSLGDGHD